MSGFPQSSADHADGAQTEDTGNEGTNQGDCNRHAELSEHLWCQGLSAYGWQIHCAAFDRLIDERDVKSDKQDYSTDGKHNGS